MKYHHLTTVASSQIYALLSTGLTQKAIAEHLGVSPSTISRELKRNAGKKGYRYKQASEKATARRAQAARQPTTMTAELIAVIRQGILSRHSPEQIAGRLRLGGMQVSHETIYRYLWRDKHEGGSLYRYLRRQGKKYRYNSGKKAGKACIPNRVDISKRSKIVEAKSRLGDFEVDTIIGAKHQGVILSLVDRKSKHTLLAKMAGKYAYQVPRLVKQALKRLPTKQRFHTVTFDNGDEFSAHQKLSRMTGLKCYFATPYHSWERGLNEHTNGLVRQYLPKGTNLELVSEEELTRIEEELNNRPRKVLGYFTPREFMMGIRRPPKIALRC